MRRQEEEVRRQRQHNQQGGPRGDRGSNGEDRESQAERERRRIQEGMQREAEEAAKRAAQRRKKAGYASNSPEPSHYQPYSQNQHQYQQEQAQGQEQSSPASKRGGSRAAAAGFGNYTIGKDGKLRMRMRRDKGKDSSSSSSPASKAASGAPAGHRDKAPHTGTEAAFPSPVMVRVVVYLRAIVREWGRGVQTSHSPFRRMCKCLQWIVALCKSSGEPIPPRTVTTLATRTTRSRPQTQPSPVK
jgi:hypothetical protein